MLSYQQLISSQLSIGEEKNKQESEMLDLLRNWDTQLTNYLKTLSEVQQFSQQQKAAAMEVKKRVGRSELKLDTIPEGATGITAALKRSNTANLDEENTKLLNKQLEISEEIKRFSTESKDEPTLRSLLMNINATIGKRLDIAQQVTKLDKDFVARGKALTPLEGKMREQLATRRMREESRTIELALSFLHSTNIDGLTALLLEYYSELIDLEDKQEILLKQREKYKNAENYLEEEKKNIHQLLPLLETEIENANKSYETESVKIKIRLVPEKTQELLSLFAAQAGHEFTATPPLLNELEKPGAIAKASQHLHEIQILAQSLEQWSDMFKVRLLSTGADAEIGQNQDKLAELDAKNATLQRRVAVISGNKLDALAKLTENEKPKNPTEWERFYGGEISILRADRLKLYQNILYLIAAQLMLVTIAAYIAILLTNLFTNHLVNNIQKRLEGEGQTALSTLSMINLLRRILKFFIWSASIILILDILGFNTSTILAGLGIGGIGVAMASREVLADVIGGLTMIIMRFYKVGDRILFKNGAYIVKDIGISYTTLESVKTKHIVNIPNAKISGAEVVNISSHPGFIVITDVRLDTMNTADKVRRAIELINEIISAHPGVRFLAIKHDHFNDYSFVINFKYDILKFGERMKVETDINCEIVKRFQEEGIKFSKP
ncbi:hypothetical protein CCP3SC1_10063 [Gammaproteobacteria bacterium]